MLQYMLIAVHVEVRPADHMIASKPNMQHAVQAVCLQPTGGFKQSCGNADRACDVSCFSVQATEALRITAPELIKLEVMDEIIPEPLGGAHRSAQAQHGAQHSAVQRRM